MLHLLYCLMCALNKYEAIPGGGCTKNHTQTKDLLGKRRQPKKNKETKPRDPKPSKNHWKKQKNKKQNHAPKTKNKKPLVWRSFP